MREGLFCIPECKYHAINILIFGSKLAFIYTNRNSMKTFLANLIAAFTPTFTREKMPALIPVRVVTKVHPDQNR